jgi:hypothetical protein
MKHKITVILLTSVIALTAGTCVAYYNTRSLGFDEDTRVFSSDEEKFSFLDFDFYYSDIDSFFERAESYLPDSNRIVTFDPLYNVVVI